MKNVAKWIVLGWSIICLIGVVYGMVSVGKHMEGLQDEAQKAGATIGVGCGMGMWVGIWLAIAGPALIIYLVSGKKKDEAVKTKLCIECGKYYEGNPKFCPSCGKEIK